MILVFQSHGYIYYNGMNTFFGNQMAFTIVEYLYLIYMVLQAIIAVYLGVRAIKTRIYFMLYFTIALGFFLMEAVFTELSENIPELVKAAMVMNYPIFYVIFTKKAFYKDRKSLFPLILSIILVTRVVHFIERYIFRYTVPHVGESIAQADLGIYYFHVTLVAIMHGVADLWLAYASLTAYKQSSKSCLKPWIKKRYLLVCISALVHSTFIIAWYLIPTDGSGYNSPRGLPVGILQMVTALLYSFINLLCWIMPRFFKRWLGMGEIPESIAETESLKKQIPEEVIKSLTSREIIMVVDILGDKLSDLINKDSTAAKGLLLMSILKKFGSNGMYLLDLPSLNSVFASTLKENLDKLNIPNVDEVVGMLQHELSRNQSLFMMLRI
ncbi:hypothetical protein GF325_03060 [Candidatus Bathyarchaeota archaeon]|nr:hypothetical protein [Candidatus Bathyarchaeota archaeon]